MRFRVAACFPQHLHQPQAGLKDDGLAAKPTRALVSVSLNGFMRLVTRDQGQLAKESAVVGDTCWTFLQTQRINMRLDRQAVAVPSSLCRKPICWCVVVCFRQGITALWVGCKSTSAQHVVSRKSGNEQCATGKCFDGAKWAPVFGKRHQSQATPSTMRSWQFL